MAPSPQGVHGTICAHYLNAYGNEEQKRRWLPKLCSGEWIAAIAMTEPGAGTDLRAVKTSAIRSGDRDHYALNGSKTFISNGQLADLIIVVAKTDPNAGGKGISLLVVETDAAPGFTRGRTLEKLGLHGQDTAELFFQDVPVPAANRLGEEGGGIRATDEPTAAGAAVDRGDRAGADGARRRHDRRLRQTT